MAEIFTLCKREYITWISNSYWRTYLVVWITLPKGLSWSSSTLIIKLGLNNEHTTHKYAWNKLRYSEAQLQAKTIMTGKNYNKLEALVLAFLQLKIQNNLKC